MKNKLATLLLCIFLTSNLAHAGNEVFQGHAEFDNNYTGLDEKLYTGKTETLEKKDTIEMTVSQVLDGSFSFEGDEFFAEVTSDVIGDKGVIIPKGTIAHGSIVESSEAKRLGRDGYINLSFDYLVTPDGREIPIEGKMSTKLHPIKAATKIVAQDLGYTAGGAVLGGLFAAQALGIESAIASQGWTLAGGAAVGSGVGLGMALYRKGKDVLISPGDEIKVKIFEKVTPERVHFIFDCASFAAPADVERALSLLASVLVALDEAGIPCGITLPARQDCGQIDMYAENGDSTESMLFELAGFEAIGVHEHFDTDSMLYCDQESVQLWVISSGGAGKGCRELITFFENSGIRLLTDVPSRNDDVSALEFDDITEGGV